MPVEFQHIPKRSRRMPAWCEFAIAAPVVALVTVVFWQFADLLWAEHLLNRAAIAAAREASLPKATSESIEAAANRPLLNSFLADVTDCPIVTINDHPTALYPLDLLESGDRVQVTLGVCASDVVPDLLRPFGLSLASRKLHVTASMTKP